MATGRFGFKIVVMKRCLFMRSERESGGFLQCKNIAYIALELVDKVHRLAVRMDSYGVSEVGT